MVDHNWLDRLSIKLPATDPIALSHIVIWVLLYKYRAALVYLCKQKSRFPLHTNFKSEDVSQHDIFIEYSHSERSLMFLSPVVCVLSLSGVYWHEERACWRLVWCERPVVSG